MTFKRLLLTLLAAFSLALPAFAQEARPDMHEHDAQQPMHHMSPAAMRAARDLDRLEALLINIRSRANINPASWRVVTGEASVLANRIESNTRVAFPGRRASTNARATAADLAAQVRGMRSAARTGDAEAVRTQAEQALRAALHLEDVINGR